MEIFSQVLLILYLLATALLIGLSINCYVMLFLFKKKLKLKRREIADIEETFAESEQELAAVTTQIAIFNELNVAERIILAVVDMEYPKGKHFIQVLDDSNDETKFLTRDLVKKLQEQGVLIELLQREDRQGYKAGALAEAMKTCQTEYVAIFDADFIPPKDFLLKAMPHFSTEQKTGLVQARWGHLNRNASVLTRVQALGIDGHFAVEQSARDWNELYMNFNGTAGILAVAAIREAGGWQADTLTEDMDLSYRMQIHGWDTRYLVDLECPAEIPEDINAFKSQQFRWAKGSIQTAKKLLPKIMTEKVRPFKKLQAVLHMTHYMIHPLMLVLALLAYPVAVLNDFSFGPLNIGWVYMGVLFCSTAPTALYFVAQRSLGGPWLKNFSVYPALMFIGSGLCISNSRAILEALTGKVSGFVRTPKKGDKEQKHYEVKLPLIPFLEIAAGIYCIWSLSGFLSSGQWMAGPFVLVYAVGFLFNGVLSLVHNGFIRELFRVATKPYALLLSLTVALAYGCATSEAGSLLFGLFYVSLGLMSLALWRLAPQKFSGANIFLLLLVAVAIRVIFFEFQETDDIHRYIWEGQVQNAGYDPYILAPSSEQLTTLRGEHWEDINHKDWSAIYGPFSLLVFKGVTSVSSTVSAMKGVLVVLDLATLAILMLLLIHKGRHLGALALYAFNPLILLAFAGEGHVDSLQMFLVMTSYLCCLKKRWAFSALFIGLAISTKFTAIIFLPFLIRRENWQWVFLAAFSAVVPAFFFEATPAQMFSSLLSFGSELRFNDSIHFLLFKIFGQGLAAWICVALLAFLGLVIWLTQDSPFRGAFFCCFAFLLLSPTVHYWYLCMLIPFLVLVPSVPAMVWSISSVFYFNVMWRRLHDGHFSHSLTDQLWQYVPVYLSVLIVLVLKVKGKRAKAKIDELPSVSVLIPVLNEGSNVRAIMNCLNEQSVKAKEVIIIDGGSTDKSVELFEREGATVIKCAKKGRGNQLSAGLKTASGDAIIIFHADMVPDKEAVEKVVTALAADPQLIGGALGARFDSEKGKYKIIALMNMFRVALTGISFGDQGQFFRRQLALDNGCLQEIPLMEDVELGMRLQALGKTRLLSVGLSVSVRRWENKNITGNALHILSLLSRYLLLRRLRSKVKVEKMYNEYYDNDEGEILEVSNN